MFFLGKNNFLSENLMENNFLSSTWTEKNILKTLHAFKLLLRQETKKNISTSKKTRSPSPSPLS